MNIENVGVVCFSGPEQFCCEKCNKVLAEVSFAVALFDAELRSALLCQKDKVVCCGQYLSVPKAYPTQDAADKDADLVMDLMSDHTIPEVTGIQYPLQFLGPVIASGQVVD